MNQNLKAKSGDTVRMLMPPPRVFTDPLGRNVWMGEVEPLELEMEREVISDPYNSADAADPWSHV